MLKKVCALFVLAFLLWVAWLGAAEKLPPPATKDAQKKMEKAEKAMKNKNPDGALALYKEVMQAEPNYAPAYLLAAVACRIKKDSEQALALLEKAIQVRPGFSPALAESLDLLNFLANQMNSQNRPEEAYGYYARIAALPGLESFRKSALIEATYNMGISAFQAQNYEQSIEAFTKMMALPGVENEGKQHYVLAQYMMGVDLSLVNRGEESSAYLRKYLDLVGSNPSDSYGPVAAYLVAKHEYSMLEAEVGKLKDDPSVTDVKARSQVLAKSHGTIPDLLQKAVAGRPDMEDAYVILSNYYYFAGDLDRAIAACRTLLEKFPTSASLSVYQNFLKKLEDEKAARGKGDEKK